MTTYFRPDRHWITIEEQPAHRAPQQNPQLAHEQWARARDVTTKLVSELEANGARVHLDIMNNELTLIHLLRISIGMQHSNYYPNPRASTDVKHPIMAYLQVITNGANNPHAPHVIQFYIRHGISTHADNIVHDNAFFTTLGRDLRDTLYAFSKAPFCLRSLLDDNPHIYYTQEFGEYSVRFLVYRRTPAYLPFITSITLAAPEHQFHFTDIAQCAGTCTGANNANQGDFDTFQGLTDILTRILP
jgi:hypothetical protein